MASDDPSSLSTLENDIRIEIEELHVFFVEWFSGSANKSDLDCRFLSHLHDEFEYIHPSGSTLGKDSLATGFQATHGSNRDFRIKIRDVNIRRNMPGHVLVTYSEWQTGSTATATGEHARLSTVLMTSQKPFRWVHLHETAMSEEAHEQGRVDGSFDF